MIKILNAIQAFILILTNSFLKIFFKSEQYLWVIGVSETAQNIFRLGKTLEPSLTVALSRRQKFYKFNYDYELGFIPNNYLRLIVRFFYGPILLGYLSNVATHFFYVSGIGFLMDV